jgi:hypothetical protein
VQGAGAAHLPVIIRIVITMVIIIINIIINIAILGRRPRCRGRGQPTC